MAVWARRDLGQWGIQIGNGARLVPLYADDALFYVVSPCEAIPKLLQLLDLFATYSGLCLNRRKSLVIPLAGLREHGLEGLPKLGLRWEMDHFWYLGVQVEHGDAKILQMNMNRVIEALRHSVEFWNTLPLSLLGRIAVAKMVVLPRCLYALQNTLCNVPKKVFRQLNSVLISLFWGGNVAE